MLHFRRLELLSIALQCEVRFQRSLAGHPASRGGFPAFGGTYVPEGLNLAHRYG
jgi:hypothetical protein